MMLTEKRSGRVEQWVGERLPGTEFVITEDLSSRNGPFLYRVRSESIGRDFAARFYPRDDVMQRRRETQVLGNLNNPHVVKLYRALDLPDHEVLLLDWVEGISLAERVAVRPLAVEDAVSVARQLVQALRAVHALGFVHAGLRPTAVVAERFAGGDLHARLVSCENVRRPGLQSTERWSFNDEAFAAPEQVRDDVLDTAVDVYQLGCLLFFMLTGQTPFAGTESAMLNAHVHQEAPRASSLNPSVRQSKLDDLILRMLRKEPGTRPELLEVLQVLEDPDVALVRAEEGQGKPKPVTSIGPDQSVVTASGARIVVRREGVSSHFDVGDREVTAVHAAAGAVFYGTRKGGVFVLELPTGETRKIVELARGARILDLTQMADELIAVDDAGYAYRIAADGTYRIVRKATEHAADVIRVAASEKSSMFALAYSNRLLTIHSGSSEVVSLALSFDVAELAVSPDGYVVAAMSEDETVLLSALDGSVLHRVRTRRTGSVTFSGGTLIGLEYTSSSVEGRVTQLI